MLLLDTEEPTVTSVVLNPTSPEVPIVNLALLPLVPRYKAPSALIAILVVPFPIAPSALPI